MNDLLDLLQSKTRRPRRLSTPFPVLLRTLRACIHDMGKLINVFQHVFFVIFALGVAWIILVAWEDVSVLASPALAVVLGACFGRGDRIVVGEHPSEGVAMELAEGCV